MKRFVRCSALAALLLLQPGGAFAETATIRVGAALDLTNVYTFVSADYSQGQRDYITFLNARGGIKGNPVELTTVDTGNEPERGIEAYERFKKDGAVLVDFLSTPVSNAVVPHALADGMNVITAFHGRSDAADGSVFSTIFPMTPAYWSQAACIVKYISDKGGYLKGKKIVLVHIDSAFGQEPVPVFQKLAERLDFTFVSIAYPSPGRDQSAQWAQVRSLQPDWVVLWGAGGGQPISVREALNSGIRPERIVSVIWLSETDLNIARAGRAKGIARFEGVAPGKRPLIQAIETEVVRKGKGAGDPAKVGSSYYNIGVASMALFAEGARLALNKEGAPLTPAKLKRGFESIRNFTADGLMAPVTITAADHQGGGQGRITIWDGAAWRPDSGWFAAYQDVVWDLVRKASAEFKTAGK